MPRHRFEPAADVPASAAPVLLDPADPAPGVRAAVERWHRERYPWPADVPTGEALVALWTAMQEPFDAAAETARRVPVIGADGYRTEYPYHDRMRDTLWAYLRASPTMRRLVRSAREDGYPWRGESEAVLGLVIAATDRAREVGAPSREGAMRAVRRLVGRVTAESQQATQESGA